MFKKVNPRQNFPEMEKNVLKFWQKNKIFEKSVDNKDDQKIYSFFDGPPFATGLPHYGHVVANLMKDVVPRYWTMRGYKVERRWGWDCHGLPVENLIEKERGIKNKREIEKLGIDKFNEACRDSVLRYADDWKKFIPRIGRWVDMENDYRTMDWKYTESIWWIFSELYKKGLVYEGYKSMHICPRCETTLSNFEVTQEYKDITDLSAVVKFKLKAGQKIRDFKIDDNTFILAWTTTPWTLPGNVALAIGEKIKYVIVKIENNFYVLAKDRVSEIFKDKEFEILNEIDGRELIGLEYKSLFNYYSKKEDLKNKENGWKIYPANFVTTEDGTGVVHIAPAFGDDDMKLAEKYNLPFVQHVGMDGRFKEEVVDFREKLTHPIRFANYPSQEGNKNDEASDNLGREVKPKRNPRETDEKVVKWLEENNKLFSKENYKHSYPHCWRCDTPLLNYATSSWFVKVTEIKDKMVANNQKINWTPEYIKDGRFGKWLEDARDWAISRSRFWGAPLPIWRCEKCKNIEVIGSVDELRKKSIGKIGKEFDLHKPNIDKVKIKCSKCGGEAKIVGDVFDCWFESGSMPYAQCHYPFENKNKFEKSFPADFIAEGIDQTRGWFYTLIVLSTALFDKPAFKNVIANGIVQAENGQKMSKRLKNYPEPNLLVEKYGADALRYYLLTSPVMKAENLNFSERGVEEVLKRFILTLWNTYSFLVMNATPPTPFIRGENNNSPLIRGVGGVLLDKWILSEFNILIEEVNKQMQDYDLAKAARPLREFVDKLSNWFVRRSRKRFSSDDIKDKDSAFQTLRYILIEYSKLLAPFMPFIAEEIYQNLTDNKESVHLEDYPVADKKMIDEKVSDEMNFVRDVVALGLAIRAKNGLKVRQPLSELKVKSQKSKVVDNELLDLIKDELNVKEVEFVESLQNGSTAIRDNGTNSDGWICEEDNKIKIALNIEITDELKLEGLAREIVRHIQVMRKEAKYNRDDKILIKYDFVGDSEDVKKVFDKWGDYIKKECLAKSVEFDNELIENDFDLVKELKLGDGGVKIGIMK